MLRLSPTPPLFPYTTLFRSPVLFGLGQHPSQFAQVGRGRGADRSRGGAQDQRPADPSRSEEHTSELQSRGQLVCRLLLEEKKEEAQLGFPVAALDICIARIV